MSSQKKSEAPKVRVVTDLHDFSGEVNLVRSVERLLSGVPAKYIAGLGSVLLRDSGGLTHSERKKRESRPGVPLLGTYYHAKGSTPPQIHLFVDQILVGWSPRFLRLPLILDVLLARPLFHELGHHIQARIEPEHRDHEAVATEWSNKLAGLFIRHRYWYLIPLFKVLVLAWKLLKPRRKK
jgi:hypothetical protein